MWTRKIEFQGKEHYLYFYLDLDNEKSNENFQQFFAYSVLLDRYILALETLLLKYPDYVSIDPGFFIPCFLKPIEDLHGVEKSGYKMMSYHLWNSYVYDLITIQHWNIVSDLKKSGKLFEDGSTFWTRRESPLFNLYLPVIPEGMKYTTSYLQAKLQEMTEHKYLILEYMLQTFLSE